MSSAPFLVGLFITGSWGSLGASIWVICPSTCKYPSSSLPWSVSLFSEHCSFVAPFLCQSCLWCRPLKFSLRLLFQDVTSCTHLMGLCVWRGVQIEGFCPLEITNCPHYIMLKRISFLHVINCLYWSKINWPESCIVAMPLLPGLA